ncbi:MAG: ABC transporter ATP-binding protein [Fervidobacterium sp.]
MDIPILEVENVSFSYGKKVVIKSFNLRIFRSDIIFLLGANGCGKTTLLKIIDGLIIPNYGILKFNGEPYKYNKSFLKKLRQNIGFVFQNPDVQIFAPTVIQELSFGLYSCEIQKNKLLELTWEFLNSWGLEKYAYENPFKLSYGYKRLITLASVLITFPSIVLLDEPTNYLDKRNHSFVLNKIKELADQNVTMIISTHDEKLIDLLSSRSKIIRMECDT